MESISSHPILEFKKDALESIRKLCDLDKLKTAESVDILEQWVKKQNHFVKKDFSREYLERALISSKGSVERAKGRIDKLCTLKTLIPKFFVQCNVRKHFKHITDMVYMLPVPKMTSDYQRIVIVKIISNDYTSSNILEYFQLLVIIAEHLKANDYVNGIEILYDIRGVNLTDLLTKLNLTELHQFMIILTEGIGARLKGVYIMSQSKVIDVFVKTIKTMLSAKIGSRIHVYQTLEELYKVVDRTMLPKEYGGQERSIDQLKNDWLDVLSSEESQKYLNVMTKACTDESCRQTDTFNEQYMGTPGTFRSLTVD